MQACCRTGCLLAFMHIVATTASCHDTLTLVPAEQLFIKVCKSPPQWLLCVAKADLLFDAMAGHVHGCKVLIWLGKVMSHRLQHAQVLAHSIKLASDCANGLDDLLCLLDAHFHMQT